MACDLCGKNSSTSKARVEGVLYNVCSDCAKYGEAVREVAPKKKKGFVDQNEVVREDAAGIIRRARESNNLKQEDFAKQLKVKVSEVHAWEAGSRVPTLEVAKRLEKMLHISLLEKQSEVPGGIHYSGSSSSGLTIGDLLKKP